jgi:hypothetical protein
MAVNRVQRVLSKSAKHMRAILCYQTYRYELITATILFFASIAACVSAQSTYSVYTPITDKRCSTPSASVMAVLVEHADTAQECQAPKGWRLFVVATNERSWIDIAQGHSLWTTEEEVVQRNDFGDFPSVDGERVEWRMSKSKTPRALIFSVSAQEPASIGRVQMRQLTRFFVVDLTTGAARFCGTATTRKEALVKADNPSACAKSFRQSSIP